MIPEPLQKGALVSYVPDLTAPSPNAVEFQFNPDTLTRTLNIPKSTETEQTPSRQKEPGQTGYPPTETISLTAYFSAADDRGNNNPDSRAFGVGPSLAALERMVYPAAGIVSGALDAVVDAIGNALDVSGESPNQPIPREAIPRVLFVWGPNRILPVVIKTLSIIEQQFDANLNPVQAQADIGLAVASYPVGTEDPIGTGALIYSQTVRDQQQALSIAGAAINAADIIQF